MRSSTPLLLFLACTIGLSPALATHSNDDELATLVVLVRATGGDAAFAFTADGARLPAAFAVATTDGAGRATFDDLDAGDDPVLTAVAPEGWALTGASCDRGEPDDVELLEGATTTCTFDLARVAGLTVVVNALGGDAAFEFEVDGDDSLPRTFRVNTDDGAGHIAFDDVAPSNVSISPDLDDDDWRLLDASCTSGDPTNLTFSPGLRVTCTFEFTSLALVRGVVWRDADQDGGRDANETGLGGRTVFADLDEDGSLDGGEPRALTGTDGKYALEGVAPGRRTIAVVLGGGWNATEPESGERSLRLNDAEVEEGVDFGVWGSAEDGPRKHRPGKQGGDEGEGNGSGRGWGYWKNVHKRADAAALDAFLAEHAGLFPENYTTDGEGLRELLQDATKQCNKKFGHLECIRLKIDARRLVLALWASGWRA